MSRANSNNLCNYSTNHPIVIDTFIWIFFGTARRTNSYDEDFVHGFVIITHFKRWNIYRHSAICGRDRRSSISILHKKHQYQISSLHQFVCKCKWPYCAMHLSIWQHCVRHSKKTSQIGALQLFFIGSYYS